MWVKHIRSDDDLMKPRAPKNTAYAIEDAKMSEACIVQKRGIPRNRGTRCQLPIAGAGSEEKKIWLSR